MDSSTSNAKVYGYNILIGAGTGSYIVAGFAIVQSLVPVHDIANAVGAMTVCKYLHNTPPTTISINPVAKICCPHPAQDLGMVLFLAISGSLFHNIAVDKVGEALPDVSEMEIGNLIAGSSSKAFQALSETEQALIIPEIASAMKTIWAFFLAAAALSVVCSLPLLVSDLHYY